MRPKKHDGAGAHYTAADFNREFRNDDACLEYIKEQRWPEGITNCAKCGVERKHYRVTGRTAYACNHCGNHIYPLAGTLFAKSTTSLKTWFYTIYLMASTEGGISARQIQRETGVTYKTAWRAFREIRRLLADECVQQEDSSWAPDEVPANGDRRSDVRSQDGPMVFGAATVNPPATLKVSAGADTK